MSYQHDETTRLLLDSLVPVICPPEALRLADDIVAHVGLTMGALPAGFRRALVVGLRGYDTLAVAWGPGGRRRAHRLPPALAERYYESWEHGPTPAHQQLAKGVGQLIKLGCYEQPAMLAAIGYTPAAWIEQVSRRRLTVYAADIERHEAGRFAPDPLRPGVTAARKEQA
jgi:hypothetical protein